MEKQPSLIPYYIFSFLLALLAWTGLGLLVIYTKPTIVPRWVFFFLFFIAVAGTFLPFFTLLHQRTSGKHQFKFTTPLRQSLVLASYADLMVWLQMGRLLEMTTATFIFAILLGIEILIQLFDRSEWSPEAEEETTDERTSSKLHT